METAKIGKAPPPPATKVRFDNHIVSRSSFNFRIPAVVNPVIVKTKMPPKRLKSPNQLSKTSLKSPNQLNKMTHHLIVTQMTKR